LSLASRNGVCKHTTILRSILEGDLLLGGSTLKEIYFQRWVGIVAVKSNLGGDLFKGDLLSRWVDIATTPHS
jgi:hypothetical protein